MKKHYFGTNEKKKSRAVLLGTSLSVFSFLIISLLLAFIISFTKDPLSAVGIAAIASLSLSGAISSFFTVKYKGNGGFISSLICTGICVLLILGVSLICSKGELQMNGVMNCVTYLSVSLLFSYLGTKTGKKRTGRHR